MNKRAKSNSIRIIAGQWRGRKLNVVDADGLRPTTDRVRETLFNWLMYEVQDSRCLDLFAGTGVLGFEALSRGADFVQFVEMNKRAQVAITSAERFLQTAPKQPFKLVFLDPPFAEDLLLATMQALAQPGWLADDALIYLEQPAKQDPVAVPENWHLHREGKAGQARYGLYSLKS